MQPRSRSGDRSRSLRVNRLVAFRIGLIIGCPPDIRRQRHVSALRKSPLHIGFQKLDDTIPVDVLGNKTHAFFRHVECRIKQPQNRSRRHPLGGFQQTAPAGIRDGRKKHDLNLRPALFFCKETRLDDFRIVDRDQIAGIEIIRELPKRNDLH